jgi:hypothetical protein
MLQEYGRELVLNNNNSHNTIHFCLKVGKPTYCLLLARLA